MFVHTRSAYDRTCCFSCVQHHWRVCSFLLVQLDDGYQQHIGDWLLVNGIKFTSPPDERKPWSPSKPPKVSSSEGLRGVAQAIVSRGLLPGIWLAPFLGGSRSQLYRRHPEWFLRCDQVRHSMKHYRALALAAVSVKDYFTTNALAVGVTAFAVFLPSPGFIQAHHWAYKSRLVIGLGHCLRPRFYTPWCKGMAEDDLCHSARLRLSIFQAGFSQPWLETRCATLAHLLSLTTCIRTNFVRCRGTHRRRPLQPLREPG
eukprot:SAG31_NODE_772_length_12197_cov_7.075963_13_plen_258_part_00